MTSDMHNKCDVTKMYSYIARKVENIKLEQEMENSKQVKYRRNDKHENR
jgi:hypothetical protein